MKKIFMITAGILILSVGVAYADAPRHNVGCGLGTLIFEGKDGLVFQVLAATTNGSFGNQTFGITSGTIECEQAASFASYKPLNMFVADNMDNLARDIAIGHGEYLETLAELMAIPDEDMGTFSETLQANFSEIYTSEVVSHVEVIENIVRVAGIG